MSLPECTCGVSEPDRFGNRDVFEDRHCPIHGVDFERQALEEYAALLIARTALERVLEQAILADSLRANIEATIAHIDLLPAP
jgi:hypothetical protein